MKGIHGEWYTSLDDDTNSRSNSTRCFNIGIVIIGVSLLNLLISSRPLSSSMLHTTCATESLRLLGLPHFEHVAKTARRAFGMTSPTNAWGSVPTAPTVIAVIADQKHRFGDMIKKLAEKTAGGEFLIGDSLESFLSVYGEDKVASIQVLVVAVFAKGKGSVVADMWPHCPDVSWIHSLSAGVDSIVPALQPLERISEIPVTNAKGAFSRSLAEYSIMAMLYFNKEVPRIQQNKKDRRWDQFVMPELYGKTVGFVGFGDIGQTTANLCRAFGMRILALRRRKHGGSGKAQADEVFTYDDSAGRLELFRRSDFIVCSLPGTPETYHFCSTQEFLAMQPTSIFISLGRGAAVDEAALIEVLKSGGIAGAALDVFEKEPLPEDSPFWEVPNIILTAHNADLTATYLQGTWALFDAKLNLFRTDPTSFSATVDRVSLERGY